LQESGVPRRHDPCGDADQGHAREQVAAERRHRDLRAHRLQPEGPGDLLRGAHRPDEEEVEDRMILRSWLFVPGDSERKLEKGRGNLGEALILDLEDSVSKDRQQVARDMVRAYLQSRKDRSAQQLWVRVNPLDTPLALPDLAAVMPGAPD